ncbi:ubiquinone/menaquinone biosynthesis C-methylase UbiE [Kitasatospora sp. MAA4]|uniref:class I SAM-dependent methyltransferase n=1 Tax=Kitasatospora sp. MAA4 TaxID=3035093 RepID=UPI00247406DC|nr:class I SAM-dependent methyltransferase [Kitasatospora sp. MAA4]MDH6132289.1 ubiquinone/menaquinone biosynthesis C-methylase UbiE [Kitasatospora sp. MAA4]
MSLYQAILDETAPDGMRLTTTKLVDRNTVWQLESSSGFAAKVTQGRAAIFTCKKAAALTLDALSECCAPFGVGEAVECDESQYILAIGLLDDAELMVLATEAGADVVASPVEFSPTSDDVRSIVGTLDDYYFGYEDRYRTVYENGAHLWESEEPNASLLQMMQERPDVFSGHIIDLGCGEGRDSLYLLSQGHTVVSVDVSHSALDRARERATAANLDASGFMERDIIYLRGFDENSFDLAMNMGCLHMLVDEDQRARHISRVYDIVRPGGYFIVDHCASEWGKGFFSIPDYEEVATGLVPGRVIPRKIRVADGEKNIDLEVLPFSERSGDALAEEISRYGFSLVNSTYTNTEAFGSSTMLLFQKPASGKQTS